MERQHLRTATSMADMNLPTSLQQNETTMTSESKSKWSVVINILLTTLTALLSALGFSVG